MSAIGDQSTFLRAAAAAAAAAAVGDGPARSAGCAANLFSGPVNIVLTLVCVALIAGACRRLCASFSSTRSGPAPTAPPAWRRRQQPDPGACWAFVRVWFRISSTAFIRSPSAGGSTVLRGAGVRRRLAVVAVDAPRRDLGALYFFVVLPILSFVLLHGAPLIGLAVVSTSLWGGILVTVVVATVGMVFSLPLGILLALGRRSELPVVGWSRSLSSNSCAACR